MTHMLWAAWMLFVATIFVYEYKDLQLENKRLTFVYGGLVLRNHLLMANQEAACAVWQEGKETKWNIYWN